MLKQILNEKEEEKYSNIKYILSGGVLLSGINIIYPLFIVSKIIGTALCGGLGGLSGKTMYYFSYDNYYKKCVLYKYNKTEYYSKYIEDHVFREQMFETYELSINYVYNILERIHNKEHILYDCFIDMKNNWFENKKLDDINHILNYYFFAIYNYFYFLKKQEIVQNIDLPLLPPYTKDTYIIPRLFEDYNLRTETLLKIYISNERLVFNTYYDVVMNMLNTEYSEENNKFTEQCKLIINDNANTNATKSNTNRIWIEMFSQRNIYDKINSIYQINQQVVSDNKRSTILGADDILPLMIDSLSNTEYKYVYSQYMFFKKYYNNTIYRDIFEFLFVKFMSIVDYIMDYESIAMIMS
jgi:hypothetical protein